MKQGKITKAYDRIIELYRTKGLPYDISWSLFEVKTALQPYVDHQGEQEMRMAEENSDGMNPDGSFIMNDQQQAAFFRHLNEIRNTDVHFDMKPAKIVLTDDQVIMLGITGEVIDILYGIVSFEVKREDGDPQ